MNLSIRRQLVSIKTQADATILLFLEGGNTLKE